MRLSRRHLLTSAAALALLILGTTVLAPWVAKRAIEHVAEAKDWTARVDGGRVGWRGIWFHHIEVDARQAASLHAEFHATCVGWSSLFGTRRLSTGSGRVQLSGALDELGKLLGERSGSGTNRTLGSRGLDYDLSHIDVEWRASADAPPQVSVANLRVTRAEGRLTLRIGTLMARHGAATVELKGAVVEPRNDAEPESAVDGRAPPWQVSAAEILAKYDTSTAAGAVAAEHDEASDETHTAEAKSAGKPAAPGAQASANLGASAPLATPSARNGSSSAKLNLTSATSTPNGKREFLPALGWAFDELERFKSELANRTDEPSARATRWMDRIAIRTRFESPALRVRIVDEGQKLELGPWPLKAERGDQELYVEVSQNATAAKSALSAKLTIVDRFERAKVKFAVGPITLPQLGATVGDFGLENIEASQLEIDAHAEFDSRTGELSVESKGWLERLSIRQPYLSRETVRNIGVAWEGAITLDAMKRQLKSDMLRLSVGPVSARLHGTVELAREYQTVVAGFEVPLAACQDLFNVLPEGLAPLLRGWRLDRTFALKLNVAFDSRKPNKAVVGFKLDNNCRVGSVPLEVAPSRFEQPFALDVEDEQGRIQSTSFGPGTWGWTPLMAISPYVESAVMVCEDGRFLHHDGFDREAISNSIRENLRAMRFARGASTVSMQLAKNLYLRRDKTIARKLQEAALTMLLEQSFNKRQLLELYLNVIEFGPGIYGIGPAAKHYFDTTPERLTLAQSFFLISLLPNPKARHFGADGLLRPGWMKHLRVLMTIAQKRGHFSDAELETGIAEQLAYRVAGNPTIAPSRRMLEDPGEAPNDELDLPPRVDE